MGLIIWDIILWNCCKPPLDDSGLMGTPRDSYIGIVVLSPCILYEYELHEIYLSLFP